jgi:hypothetical protein
MRKTMLKRLELSNFTAFGKTAFDFSRGLNIIVGANGTGKTQLLKLGFMFLHAWPDLGRTLRDLPKHRAEAYYEERLAGLFRPGELGNLLRKGSSGAAELAAELDDPGIPMAHLFLGRTPNTLWRIALSRYEKGSARVEATHLPDPAALDWSPAPVFIPSKEIVSLFEGLIGHSKSTRSSSTKPIGI